MQCGCLLVVNQVVPKALALDSTAFRVVGAISAVDVPSESFNYLSVEGKKSEGA